MNPYEQYRKVSLTMADPGRLIVRLYDRAVQDLEVAMEAVQSGDVARRSQCVTHAQEIISELMGALNLKAGGEVAANLQRLYLYMIRRLVEANRTLGVPLLKEVAGLLRELREGWAGVSRPADPEASTATRTA